MRIKWNGEIKDIIALLLLAFSGINVFAWPITYGIGALIVWNSKAWKKSTKIRILVYSFLYVLVAILFFMRNVSTF